MPHRSSRLLLACVAVLCLTHCSGRSPGTAQPQVLLAIFAHPDDEASVGPVLAKYAAAGVKVHLAVATDGRLGTTEHAGLDAGEPLAAVRARELQCAAERLGLQRAVAFGLEDQLKMGEGLGPHSAQISELRLRVRELLQTLQPDVVITWPASGWTGHPDHRLVSTVVTEVFQSQPWIRPARLYYPAVPVGRLPQQHPLFAASMDPRFLNVEVALSSQDYERARQAWLCHRSQYTPEMIEQLHQSMLTTQQGIAHFQAIPASLGKRTSLFSGNAGAAP
jgi:LmbE family N-acetylglucosaminyl deacetylase